MNALPALSRMILDMSKFAPSEEEAKNGMTTKNAVSCTICGAPADLYGSIYSCQANPNHVGDTMVGIFSDLTFPGSK